MAKGNRKSTKTVSPASVSEPQTNFCDVLLALTTRVFPFLQSALWPAALSFWALCAMWSIQSLAGKETNAKILAQFAANWGLDVIIPYIVGASGTAYGLYERKLRKQSIAQLRAHGQEREEILDPRRSSSGLLPGGDMPKDT